MKTYEGSGSIAPPFSTPELMNLATFTIQTETFKERIYHYFFPPLFIWSSESSIESFNIEARDNSTTVGSFFYIFSLIADIGKCYEEEEW
jgi:hypothetical protein